MSAHREYEPLATSAPAAAKAAAAVADGCGGGQESLATKPYYHGHLPREDVEELLVEDGQFLVRKTDVGRQSRFVISGRAGGRVRHIVVCTTDDGAYTVDKQRAFKSIASLVAFYSKKKREPLGTAHIVLMTPVPRQQWQLAHDQITLGKRLGAGAFGEVFKGELRRHKKDGVAVAVKTLKSKAAVTKAQRQAFVAEARIMRAYKHPNIVRLMGIAVTDSPVMLVLEFCPGGALLDMLKAQRRDATNQDDASARAHAHRRLLQACVDAALGLAYLESLNTVHRDIAARNCLLGADGTAKISDFGLSLSTAAGASHIETGHQHVPLRWLAPETLERKEFSHKTDVWAFGVLMHEVYTFGDEPYAGMGNAEVRQKVQYDNYRLPPPPHMPCIQQRVMYLCWHETPAHRPAFRDVAVWLARLLVHEGGDAPTRAALCFLHPTPAAASSSASSATASVA